MDVAWSYGLPVPAIYLGLMSFVIQCARALRQQDLIFEAAASALWILANVLWCAEDLVSMSQIPKTVVFALAGIYTALVLWQQGRLRRG